MKRISVILLAFIILATSVVFTACSNDTPSEESSAAASEEQSTITDESEASAEMNKPDENAELVWKDTYADNKAKLQSASDIYQADFYFDGKLSNQYNTDLSTGDGKFIFAGLESSRFVNVSEGYMLTVPFTNVKGDFSLSEFRAKLIADTSVITITTEDQNPYGNNKNGWDIYLNEWLTVRFGDINFLNENKLMRTDKVTTRTDWIEGYEVLEYDLFIKLSKDIEMPYYNIAIIRKNNEYVNFYLVVMKSTENVNKKFADIISSMSFFTPEGKTDNHIKQNELKIPENWNGETKAYYEKLRNQTGVDWGFFYEGNSNSYIDWMKSEAALNYIPEVFMTYLHIGWYDTKNNLDLDFVRRNAGGNGFDGKPVLNLTYQFTTTNNAITGYTPMFDIMRGKFDDHFRKLASDIKEYGKPVIFRLNNEMNTDWTSYAGIVTLLDPDIYVDCWRRLYDIFVEEGVDNTIWVFNPISVTCPFCDWGEAMCYYPGDEYVQMLGLTHYEDGNTSPMNSFKTNYTKTYNKFKDYFIEFPWIIGEFGCGAGGAKQYSWDTQGYLDKVQGRAEEEQAAWCKAMFECFSRNQQPGYEFCKNIKVAVWFSCNDYCNIGGKNYITNYYKLDEALEKTIAVFKEWLPKMHDDN